MLWFLVFLKNVWDCLESSLVHFLKCRQKGSISLLWNDHNEYVMDLIFPAASSVQSLEAPKSREAETWFNSQEFSSIICTSIRRNYSAKSWWLKCKFTSESIFPFPSALRPHYLYYMLGWIIQDAHLSKGLFCGLTLNGPNFNFTLNLLD